MKNVGKGKIYSENFKMYSALYNNKTKHKKYVVVICLVILIIVIAMFSWYNTFNKNELIQSHNKEYSKNLKTILWWTRHTHDNRITTCGIYKCFVTGNRSYLNRNETKVITYYGSSINLLDLAVPRLNHHLWALLHEESPKNLPYIQHDNVLKHFNYTATFSRYSDMPLTLLYLKDYETLISKKYVVPIGDKSKLRKDLAPIVFMQTRCNDMSGRNEYVKNLMQYVSIDSYGKCLHNKKLPSSLEQDFNISSDEIYKFLAPYKFIIAYENGVCNDYITEKFWRPLVLGSIPIYFGSPTIKDWLPNKKSAILISDFNSPRDLADFIKKLDENDHEYNKYLDHKYSHISPISNSFLKDALFNRDYKYGYNTFFYAFECFLCKELNSVNIKYNQYANKLHYDCGNELVYPKMNRTVYSDWVETLKNGKCHAQVLDRLLTNNRNYTEEDFQKEVMNGVNNKICKI